MRKLILSLTVIIICAGKLPAQVIDYTIDPSFNSGELFTRGEVSDLLLTSTGDYMVMGMFSFQNDLIEHGSLITNTGQLLEPNISGTVYAKNYQDKLLFFSPGMGITDYSGTLTPFFFEFQKSAYSGPLSAYVYDAMITPEENILVAGRFFTDSTLIGTSQTSLALRQLCMVDSTGAPVPDFPMLRCNQPVDATINSIRKLSTGEYIISGHFAEVEGHLSHKIAKLNADFSVNTEFESPFGAEGYHVYVLFIDSQDRLWVFRPIQTNVTDYPNYQSLLVRLLPDGTVDTTLQDNVFTTYLVSDIINPQNAFSTTPYIILEDEDGTFILGGSFIEINGEPHNRLIKIQDNGEIIQNAFGGMSAEEGVWENWTPGVGPIAGTSISQIIKLPDGKLLLGGTFSSFGGEPYNCLVRLKPDGFVGIDKKEGRGKLKIYPNPAESFVTIELPQGDDVIKTVEILTMQGRVIKQVQNYKQADKLSLAGLVAGVYIVTARTDDGIFTQKLVVE